MIWSLTNPVSGTAAGAVWRPSHDPMTFVAVAVLLLTMALGACWIPARKATQVHPMVALRYE